MTIKPVALKFLVIPMTVAVAACSSDSDNNAVDLEPPAVDPDAMVCNDADAVNLSETDAGDFSDDPASPNSWPLGAGINQLSASTESGDLDYVQFTVGNCDTLDTITVNAYSSDAGDPVAFFALQQGTSFTVTPAEAAADTSSLFGFRHFGTADIGVDVLAEAGQAPGAVGFTSPLPAGDYALWLNQTGSLSTYTFDFAVSRVAQ